MPIKQINFTAIFKNFFLLLRTLAFIIIILEISVRIFLYAALSRYVDKHIPQPYQEITKDSILSLYPDFKFDPICYYLPRQGFFRSTKGRIDVPLKKNTNEVRIICIGDSTTYGLCVKYDKSWPYLLEQLLKNKFPDKNIKVLNAGLQGASSRQIKRIFQFHLVKYNPDIVIWRGGIHLSDTYEVNLSSDGLRNIIWRCLSESRIFRSICVLLDNNKTNYTADEVFDYIMRSALIKNNLPREFNSDFDMVRKIAFDHGTKYVLCVEYLNCNRKENINSEFDGHKISPQDMVVFTLPAFKEKLKKDSLDNLFVDDVHLTETGESLTAEEIYKLIINKKLIEAL